MHFTLHHRGLAVSRALRAIALARPGGPDAATIASQRWGAQSDAVQIVRAAQGTDWAAALAATSAGSEFIGAVREMEILSRLPGLRRVPPLVRHLAATEGTIAGFVAEHAPIPVTAMALSADSLKPRKVAGIIAATNETLESSSVESENILQADLVRAAAEATDAALLDPLNTGSDSTPASLTHDAPSAAATGDATTDFATLIELFAGDLTSAAFVMDPYIAVRLALYGGETFRDVGATGGLLLGLPVLTSRAVPRDSSGGLIALIDGSGITAAEESPEFTTSQAATIQLDTAPDDPIDPGVSLAVNLFQAEVTALKVIRRIIWRRARPGAVATLTGAEYGGS